MLVRLAPMPNIIREFDSLFNAAVPFPAVRRFEPRRFSGLSVSENGEQVTVRMELPGVQKEQVSVNVREGYLSITAERKRPELKEQEQWLRNEMTYGTIERSIELPCAVDVDKVTAQHENGILTVVLPKHELAKPKQITVR